MSTTPSPDKRLSRFHISLKIFSFVVLTIISVVIIYVLVMVAKNWSHIGV